MEKQPLSLSKMTVSHINKSIIFEEVMATHDPDNASMKDFKASYILNFVKKILFLIMTAGKAIYEDEESDDNESDDDESDNGASSNEEESNHKEVYMYDENEPKDVEHPYQIKLLSFEIALKCSDNMDPHSTVMYFLNMLAAYPWEAKILMMLAAFSINFGEFSLVHGHKGLAGKLAILKGSKSPLAPSHIQGSISLFIKSVLHLTERIVDLAQSSSYSSSPIIPVSCYWILTSILTYASYSVRSSEWLIAKGTELSSLTAIVKDLFSYCRPILEMKREEDSYNALWCAFSDENPIPSTNLDVLKLIFNVKDVDKEKPLFDGKSSRMVELRSLENKSLFILISSGLDIEFNVLIVFIYFPRTARLWIPILDYPTLLDTKTMKNQYRFLAKLGELLVVKKLQKSVAPRFARFVKKKFFPTFQIGGEPIIVSLDHHGKIVHYNAVHMLVKRALDFAEKAVTGVKKGDSIIPLLKNVLKERTSAVRDLVFDIDRKISDFADKMNSKMNEWLRGIESEIENSIDSIIFKTVMEKDPWKEETWCTKLLIGKGFIDGAEKWINENENIFLIGGNGIKWVKTFVSKVLSEIHFTPQLTIKMAYIGSNKKVASVIGRDKVCETLDTNFLGLISFLWARLQSIFL